MRSEPLKDNEIDYLNDILKNTGYSIFINSAVIEIEKHLGLNWLQIKRRALKRNIIYEKGYHYSEMFDGMPKKAKICFNCEMCKKEYKTQYYKLISRNYKNTFCGKCYIKNLTNTVEWKKKNSEAQKIAQNREETKEKNRLSQIKRHKNIEVKEHYREIGRKLWENEEYAENIRKKIKEKWQDQEYADKVFLNSSKKWIYQGKFENTLYQSLCELSFILEMFFKNIKIKRYDLGPIGYLDENNNKRSYYPDFITNENNIIEIKGNKSGYKLREDDINLIQIKQEAAKIFCINNNNLYNYNIIYISEQDTSSINFHKLAKKVHNGQVNKEELSTTYRFSF